MGVVKAKTVAERFGFKDEQLTTPAHDEIMLAVTSDVTQIFKALNLKPLKVCEPIWEYPVVDENMRTGQKFVVGFVDVCIEYKHSTGYYRLLLEVKLLYHLLAS